MGGVKLSMGDGSGGMEAAMTCLRQLQEQVESSGMGFRSEDGVGMFLSAGELLLRGC